MNKESNEQHLKAGDSKHNSSRPSSASSFSSRASATKNSSNKHHGPKKEELLKNIADLQQSVENLSEENQELKATVQALIDKFIENGKIKGVRIPKEIINPDVSEIPRDSLVNLAEMLTAESHKSNTMEGRVEELETRITHLNMELAKLLHTRLALENGLEELCECSTLNGARAKAKQLIYEAKGSELFTYLDSIPSLDVEPSPNDQRIADVTKKKPKELKDKDPQPASFISVLLNDKTLDLIPPAKKMPGETHIKQMHKDLKQYVMQQLSLPKGNGADWRLFAERVGIPNETIQQWKCWKLDLPMQYVLQTWAQSPAATVRLLHRHLVSPQLHFTLLAKRISDFYQVD
ncbi:hypothetical protein ACJMK2_036559 [Sinanodonta woodiana]|uniref:Death domain-containing protein n=1 Tax=Sinanodonta woodiana TaxID=1069815 RepID=A0ABD3WKZ0_SINWO